MLILSDSGILLRLFEPRDPQHAIIRLAVDILIGRGEELVTAPQNVAEFWNVCTRPATARGGFGLGLTHFCGGYRERRSVDEFSPWRWRWHGV